MIEAGTGEPDLLTLDAVQVLRTSEVVLHDDLVSEATLELVPASAQVRNVSAFSGQPGISPEKTYSLLVSAARDGRQVVRLKAAGSLSFGRADEEIEALTQAGVDYEVVADSVQAVIRAAAGV